MKRIIPAPTRPSETSLLVFVLTLVLATNVANADFTFGTPTNLGPTVNSSYNDYDPSISADGLSLYFNSYRPGGSGGGDTWVTTRKTTDDPWSSPMNLGPTVNSSSNENAPSISYDGLSLYFSSNLPGGYGDLDLWVTTRETKGDAWGTPVNLGPGVNSSASDHGPSISADGLTLYFSEHPFGPFRPGGFGYGDIWVTTRPTTTDTWGEPVNLGPTVNSSFGDINPEISADGLLLFFDSRRTGGLGNDDIWVTRRATTNDPWAKPVNLGPGVNSSLADGGPRLSADGLSLFFHSSRPGGYGGRDLWQVSIEPVVDFNGDGIVDSADMCIMVDHWGENYPLCDIGPTPFGDGIVDVQDLIILAEYLFTDYRPIAHWKLDEAEGDIAYDCIGNNNAVVNEGEWTEGIIDGALRFNGFNTYMDCGQSEALAPEQMTFEMWIEPAHMGGMRYIVSRASHSSGEIDYELMRHLDGELELVVGQFNTDPVSVLSTTKTALGEWSRVMICLDGSQASIYINDALAGSANYGPRVARQDYRLVISSHQASTRFYNGKIDDVRIYNRVVSP